MADSTPGLAPDMTQAEAGVLRECYGKASSLVEFGSGGSTLLAVETPALRRIWSVESDPAWIARLRGHAGVAQAESDSRLQFVHADIGPTGGYGMPLDESARARWPGYHQAVWADPATAAADLVLVDGRFRVACALQALLHCQPHAVLLFHDFWSRTAYHPVLAFTDWLGSCDSLAILRRKPVIDQAKLDRVLQAHRLQPL